MKSPTEEIQHLGQMLTATEAEDTERLDSIIERLQELKAANGIEPNDPSFGTTAMIIRTLAASGGIPTNRVDQYREALVGLSIDDFLKALIADSDLEHIVAVLDTANAEEQGKQVKLFDEDGKQIYPAL